MKTIWTALSKLAVTATMSVGVLAVSGACWGIYYQPTVPESLRKQ